jgi:hypothetical protein
MAERGIDDQRAAVLHQQMTHEAQPARLPVALAVEPGIRVGGRGVGFVRPLLAAEVARAVAPLPPAVGASSPPSSLGRRLFIDAKASISCLLNLLVLRETG